MDYSDLLAYKKAFAIAMEIFELSKNFPAEKKYSLTVQIRRSSRSVCSNIAEYYHKRNCPRHFTNKLTDSDGENSETLIWLEFASAGKCIDKETPQSLEDENKAIGKLMNYMILNPEKFGSGRSI